MENIYLIISESCGVALKIFAQIYFLDIQIVQKVSWSNTTSVWETEVHIHKPSLLSQLTDLVS